MKTIPLFLLLLGFAGCAAPTPVLTREPYVKPGLIMLTADQAEQRGLAVTGPDQAATATPPPPNPRTTTAVLHDSSIRVYTFNRAVDPADREMMHEAHVVYRRETGPRWRLDAAADQQILVGPQITESRTDLQPVLDRELTAFLADQRRATEANQKAIQALFEAVQTLSGASAARSAGPQAESQSPAAAARQ